MTCDHKSVLGCGSLLGGEGGYEGPRRCVLALCGLDDLAALAQTARGPRDVVRTFLERTWALAVPARFPAAGRIDIGLAQRCRALRSVNAPLSPLLASVVRLNAATLESISVTDALGLKVEIGHVRWLATELAGCPKLRAVSLRFWQLQLRTALWQFQLAELPLESLHSAWPRPSPRSLPAWPLRVLALTHIAVPTMRPLLSSYFPELRELSLSFEHNCERDRLLFYSFKAWLNKHGGSLRKLSLDLPPADRRIAHGNPLETRAPDEWQLPELEQLELVESDCVPRVAARALRTLKLRRNALSVTCPCSCVASLPLAHPGLETLIMDTGEDVHALWRGALSGDWGRQLTHLDVHVDSPLAAQALARFSRLEHVWLRKCAPSLGLPLVALLQRWPALRDCRLQYYLRSRKDTALDPLLSAALVPIAPDHGLELLPILAQPEAQSATQPITLHHCRELCAPVNAIILVRHVALPALEHLALDADRADALVHVLAAAPALRSLHVHWQTGGTVNTWRCWSKAPDQVAAARRTPLVELALENAPWTLVRSLSRIVGDRVRTLVLVGCNGHEVLRAGDWPRAWPALRRLLCYRQGGSVAEQMAVALAPQLRHLVMGHYHPPLLRSKLEPLAPRGALLEIYGGSSGATVPHEPALSPNIYPRHYWIYER